MKLNSKPEFVTAALVFVAFTSTLFIASQSQAALYKVSLLEKSKVLAFKTIDTKSSSGGFGHSTGGSAYELQDKVASCGVFVKPGGLKNADVMVSLIQIETDAMKASGASRKVVSNSAMLTKLEIEPEDQTVYPGSAGTRTVSVEAPELNRTCVVTVL